MRWKCLLIVFLLVHVGSASGQIEYTNSLALTLDDCIAEALENNLDIRIRRVQPRMDGLSIDSARGAYDPNLTMSANQSFSKSPGSSDPNSRVFGVGSDTTTESYGPGISGLLPTGTRYRLDGRLRRQSGTFFPSFQYNSDLTASITQPLLKDFRIDSTRRTIAVARRTLKINELALSHQIMRTINSVEKAYYELVYARDNVRVQESSLSLAGKHLRETSRRVELGALAPLDRTQAESQAAARRADLLSAQVQLDTRMNTLKGLLSDDFAGVAAVQLNPTDKLLAVVQTFDAQDSWVRGLEQRPDLLQSKETLERQEVVLRFNKNQILPSLDLQLTYGHNGFGTDLRGGLDGIRTGAGQGYSYGLVFSIPWSNRTAKKNYQSSRLEKQRMLLSHKQLEQQIIIEIDNALRAARNAYQRIDATREARRYAEAALEAEEKKFANGKSTGFFVLQLQRDLTASRSSELRALADYNNTLADLWLSEGATLERRGVVVQFD